MLRISLTDDSVHALTRIRNEQDATGGQWVSISRFIELTEGIQLDTQERIQLGGILVGAGYLERSADNLRITKRGRTALVNLQ